MIAVLQGSSPVVQVVVTAPPDHEWLKLIVSLGVGVIVGVILGVVSALFLEPMKVNQLRKIQADEARELIYEELGAILIALNLTLPMGDPACKALLKRLPTQRYDYYFKDRREVFYAIPDYHAVWALHAQLGLNREPEAIAKYGAKHAVGEMLSAFEFAMAEGEVDKKLIETAQKKHRAKADEQSERLMNHIRKGPKA
jgi:hypothetical protein